MLCGLPFCEGFVDGGIPQVFLDAAIVVDIAAEQTSYYVFVTFDADEIVIIFEGGGQLPLAWRQVGGCRSVILFSGVL